MVARAAVAPHEAGAVQVDEPARCSLRDHLVARGRAGDLAAVELLIGALPPHLPSVTVLAARDERIRALGRALATALPGKKPHGIATMIAAAGQALDRGDRTAARQLPSLTTAELAAVERDIIEILGWLKPRQNGRRWLRARQVFSILQF